MRINEIFNKVLPYKWEKYKDTYWAAKFEIDDKEYTISASFDTDGWHKADDPSTPVTVCDLSFTLADDGFSGTKVVGTSGNEFLIFATVLDAFETFVREKKPKIISVNASKENLNRFKLYSRIAKKLEPKLKSLGYKQIEPLVYDMVDVSKYFDSLTYERD